MSKSIALAALVLCLNVSAQDGSGDGGGGPFYPGESSPVRGAKPPSVAPAEAGVIRTRGATAPPDGFSYEPIHKQYSAVPAGIFNSNMIFVADQLDHNVAPESRSQSTVITSFVNLNNLAETSALGRLIGEHLMHELQMRGWPITDLRLTRDLIINETGEFSLSRDMKRLREKLPAVNVVTGTYTVTNDGLLLSVRIIELGTGHVVSTAQTRFVHNRFIASLVDKPRPVNMVSLTR